MNQHGVVEPGWLFSSNYATAIHPRFGITATLNITNVPSGTSVYGSKGEELKYAIANAGTTTNPDWRLTQWNSSRVFISQITGFINASLPSRYDWNVSISPKFANNPAIKAAIFNDVLLVSNGSLPTVPSYLYAQNATFWGFSLKQGEQGRLLWDPLTST